MIQFSSWRKFKKKILSIVNSNTVIIYTYKLSSSNIFAPLLKSNVKAMWKRPLNMTLQGNEFVIVPLVANLLSTCAPFLVWKTVKFYKAG